MSKLNIILDSQQRQQYIDRLLAMDGLSHIKEDEASAYCPISLTQTPDEVKPYLAARQEILIDEVLAKVGITGYDPYTAPYSPDKNLDSLPQEIYLVDSGKIASSRFFVGHNITASTGFGVELEKAVRFNRIAVILLDKQIRVSRMQPHRVIYLQYDNFRQQAKEIKQVFEFLQGFDPGMGMAGDKPVLAGFDKETGKAINLEQAVYDRFPDLKYEYDGSREVLKLKAANPELFYEESED
jgi:hypothetical protein